MRFLVAFFTLVTATAVLAQQPLSSPIYYLSTAPRLEPGVPVVGTLTALSGRNFKDGSYVDVLTLRGKAGEFVEVTATSNEFDTYLSIFAPDGSLLAANDDDPIGFGTDSAIRVSLPETGTYVVVVSGYGTWDLGRYTITRNPATTPDDSGYRIELPSVTFGELGPRGDARFRLVLDETAAIGIEVRSAAFDTTVELLDEHGLALAYNDDAPAGDLYTTDSAMAVLLGPGSYEIVVVPFSADAIGDGSFELEVVRLVPGH